MSILQSISQTANYLNNAFGLIREPDANKVAPIELTPYLRELMQVKVYGVSYESILKAIRHTPINIGESDFEKAVVYGLVQRLGILKEEFEKICRSENLIQRLELCLNKDRLPHREFLAQHHLLSDAVDELIENQLLVDSKFATTVQSAASINGISLQYPVLIRSLVLSEFGDTVLTSLTRENTES